MGMLSEFREFAMKGNVVDLAVGVIIGAAFGAIVTSLVGDIIMPIIGSITGGLDFSNYYTGLSKSVSATNLADAKKQGAHRRLRAVHRDPCHEPVEAQGRGCPVRTAEADKAGRTADRDPRSPQEELKWPRRTNAR